jgi:molybdate transport system substrate-binding protein
MTEAPRDTVAAASLTEALQDISAQWTQAGHRPLRMVFGSSLALAQQIVQGAPANMFASADERSMDYLAEKNLIASDTRKDLLWNSLVLIVPIDKPRYVVFGPSFDLLGLLGPNGRLATGDPLNVPAGIYAEQALKYLGVWDAVSARLARADDVRAALLLVERGEAAVGIVYATDAAMSKRVMVAGRFPAEAHVPISYPFAVTKSGDTAEARTLMAYLAGPQARTIFVKHRFRVEY